MKDAPIYGECALMVRSQCRARDQARLDANLISQNNKGFPRFWLARVLLCNPQHTRQSWAGFFYLILRRKDMKKLILASAILAAFGANVAQAADAAPAPEHAVSYNIGVASEYRYRGISQSRKDPAVSAGADYVHNPTGLYLGTWLSSIKWVKDAGGDGSVEWDIYGGKRGEIGGGFSYDLGGLYYYYPNNNLKAIGGKSADTFEVYGQIGYGPAYLKYSHALTDTFATGESSSYYIDAGVNYPIEETLVLNLHYGHQSFANAKDFNYSDWKIGLTKDFGFVSGAIAVIGTDADKTSYSGAAWGNTYVGSTTAVVSLTKAF